MYKCQYCNKEFERKKGLISHNIQIHNKLITYDERKKYFDYVLVNKEIPKCCICGINDIYFKNWRIPKICNNLECHHKYLSLIQQQIQINHPELREKARERRIKYLSDKTNFDSTAYGKRANKELSFLEKWFYDKIIQQYNLTNKYTIINEYTESKYFLDFAFINIKLDVELDGKCHFNNDNKRINHDIERDKYLIDKGWKIYRISWYDVKYNEENIINNFINLLKDNNFIYDKSYYIRHKVISNKEFKNQEESRNNKKKLQLEVKQNKYIHNKNIIIDLEQNSNIDFSKFGWVNKANQYLLSKNIVIKKLHWYINKYYPEFFTNNKVYIKSCKQH